LLVGPVLRGAGGDPLVPGGYALAGARLEQAGAPMAHLLPGLRRRLAGGPDLGTGRGLGAGVGLGAGLAAEDLSAQLRDTRLMRPSACSSPAAAARRSSRAWRRSWSRSGRPGSAGMTRLLLQPGSASGCETIMTLGVATSAVRR